jgi:predicted nucleic acid binding AN1-type Zn finger protein
MQLELETSGHLLGFFSDQGNKIYCAHSSSVSAFEIRGKEPFLPYKVSMCFSYFCCSAVFAIFSEFNPLISWWECRFNDIYFGKHVL